MDVVKLSSGKSSFVFPFCCASKVLIGNSSKLPLPLLTKRSFTVVDRETGETVTLDITQDHRPQSLQLVRSRVDSDKQFPEIFVSC